MAHPTVVSEVAARLAANWSTTPIIGLNTQGETPADGSPFMLVDYPLADVERMSIGTRLYRETGGFRLVLHIERGSGIATGLTQSEALAAIFRDQKFGAGLAVNTLAPGSPIIDERNESGAYVRLITVVIYTFDYQA